MMKAFLAAGVVVCGVMLVVWIIFAWLVDQFGREVAATVFWTAGGVLLAVTLWIGSGVYTARVWREAHRHTESSSRMTVELLRSSLPQQRYAEQTQLVRERQLLLAMRSGRPSLRSPERTVETADDEAVEVVNWR